MPGLQLPLAHHKSHSIAMSKLKASKGRSNTSVSKWSVDIDMSNVVSVQKILRVKCKPSTTIMEIKKKLRKTVGYPLEFQRLYIRDHVEVKNHLRVIDLDGSKTLDEEDIKIDNITLPMLTFHIRPPLSSGADLGTICFYGNPPRSKALFILMMEAQAGLAQRFRPEIQLGGSAGTYVLRNQFKDRVACFKPFDEEPRAPNNPRPEYIGVLGDVGLREGIRSGQGCLREVAAFLIDSEHFHNVPYTCLCEASDDAFNYRGGRRTPKLGSFQQFVEHDTCMSDYSSSSLDVDEVHKIGLLDLRIMNVDRNDGNVLVSFVSTSGRASANSLENGDGTYRRDSDERRALLIPIDHGYCLPDKIHVDPLDWCWYYWKQAKKPFSSSTIKYVDRIDVDRDSEMLHRELKIDLPSLRTMRVSGRLMKIGVAKGLTLFEIAEMVAREEATEPSRLEVTVNEAFELSRCRFLGDSAPTCSFELKSHGEEENLCNDIELLNLVHQGADAEESGSEISLSVSPYRLQSSNTSELPSEASPIAYSPRNDVAPPVKLTNTAPLSARKGSSQLIMSVDDDVSEYRGKVVEVDSEEDINSISRSTPDAFAMVKPDSTGCFTRIPHVKTDCLGASTSTACSSMSSANSSPTSNFADELWKNVLFEKDFYKTLEILIARDVDALILAR